MAVRKWGSEIVANTTAIGNQFDPDITFLPGGGFLVVWIDESAGNSDVKAQFFDAVGGKAGLEFTVNTSSTGDQVEPAVTTLTGGSVVIAWTDQPGTLGSDWDIKFRRFTAEGAALDAQEIVAAFPNLDNHRPRVAATPDGGFIITSGYESSEIYGVRYDATGAMVDDYGIVVEGNPSVEPDMAVLASGAFAVTFIDEFSNHVTLEILNADGGNLTDLIAVTESPQELHQDPHVVALRNGGLVVAWTDNSGEFPDTDSFAIRARLFTPEGIPVGGSFIINTFSAGPQYEVDLTALADGGFAAVYTSESSIGTDSFEDVHGQVFNADGSRRGVEFILNTVTGDEQEHPAITVLADGRIAVVWADEDGQLEGGLTGSSINAQILDPRDGIVSGSEAGETLYGHDAYSDEISGFGGSDTLVGLRGDDSLYGGEGNDFAGGGHGDDVVYGGLGNDVLHGNSGEDAVHGEGGNDLLYGGNHDDELLGGAGLDVLFGEKGADVINGGSGIDTANYSTSGAAVVIALDGSLGVGGDAAGDVVINTENLVGSEYNDRLTGSFGNNTIIGGGSSDRITGGELGDTLSGGEGSDRYFYNAVADFGDVILDFSAGSGNNDTLMFKASAFGALGRNADGTGRLKAGMFISSATNAAVDGDDLFILRTTDKTLWFDADGNGATAPLLAADLQDSAVFSISDVVFF